MAVIHQFIYYVTLLFRPYANMSISIHFFSILEQYKGVVCTQKFKFGVYTVHLLYLLALLIYLLLFLFKHWLLISQCNTMIWPKHATHIILLPLCYSMLMNNRLGRSPLLSCHLVL